MISEPGIDYTPRPEPPDSTGDASSATQMSPVPLPQRREIRSRPVVVRIVIYLLLFVAFNRIGEAVMDTQHSAGIIVVRFLSGITLLLITVGLIGMRRWGLWLAVIFSYWHVISLIMVGVYRISQISSIVTNRLDRDTMIMTELLRMGLGAAIYAALGTWLVLNRQRFLPSLRGWDTRGHISALVLVGILILYTGTRISTTRSDLKAQAAQMQESQSWLDNSCTISIMKLL